ncbi:glycosyltransferase [Rhodohalobacter sp. SW132]|uniref:glycosyltransferase family 2 protein n=1 Tax=Rhodohalobacter sp. SW132 TaxID=2293433 RepID=UPI000E25D27E|nr:glycosyltransferase family 2 protein [Rhodohalobacter sp. SW132]REL24733.1 glycosyltransferase [Rhodohalobacter sp. SW132]
MNPKISIVTIAYNNAADIRPTLESVVNQTYDNIEYVVVDGDSSDGTVEIINEYKSGIDTFISEPDKGMYDAINKGIKASTGDIVGLIHAGDRLFDEHVIGKIANHFSENEIDASYGQSVLVGDDDQPVRVNISPEFSKSLFKIGWMPSHQSIYIRREIFDQLDYYRTDLGGSGDYEFVLRYFYFNDLRVKRLDEYIIRFSMGGRSTSNYHKILKTQMVHVNCWKLNGQSPPIYMVPLKLLRKVPQFLRAFKMKLKSA